MDYVDLMLAVVEGYRSPSAITRTGLSMLDDFAKEYRGYIGKMLDYVCMKLRSLLYEALEEGGGILLPRQ